jgi:hypothetical protein
LGSLYKECSKFSDFVGITVTYSGNQSFHFHIVFSTCHAKALGIKQNIREGLDQHWHRLLKTVMNTLKPGVTPDMSMSQPDKYRRLPNGVRKLDAPNLLGIPAGEFVPQVTIWKIFEIGRREAGLRRSSTHRCFCQGRLSGQVPRQVLNLPAFG